jgi:hypothetical protein
MRKPIVRCTDSQRAKADPPTARRSRCSRSDQGRRRTQRTRAGDGHPSSINGKPTMILDLGALLATFTASLNNYYPLILTYGTRLLGILVVLGLGLVAVRVAASGSIVTALHELLWGVIKLGLVFAIMEHLQDWGTWLYWQG